MTAHQKFRATVPRLPVADVTRTLEFYVGKLGFEPHYRFGDEAAFGLGQVIVRICQGEPITSEDFRIYFEISQTDALFEQFQAAGDVEVYFAPRHQPWGSREFCIVDPDGYHMVFGDFRDDSSRSPSPPLMALASDLMARGAIEDLRDLLEANPELVNSRCPATYRDDRQATLLHVLMDYPNGRHPENIVGIAQLLLDCGADGAATDASADTGNADAAQAGSTPLQLLMSLSAPTAFDLELTKMFLQAGAPIEVGSNDQHGMDAFSAALMNGHTEAAALMHSSKGYPLNFAWVGAGLGDMKIVRSFFAEEEKPVLPVEQCADALSDDARQGQMNCAFLVASINGQTEVIDYLLNRGQDINVQPPGSDFAGIGATALHWAARFGHLSTLKHLVERGAKLAARDDVFQLTPATWAAWHGHFAAYQYLREQTREP